ncbi:MAG: SDR family oxidoreductase [Hahellaceae bacterium]|nr:SDR family oxidoreductase [Hahellaceae bacterium]
MKNQTALITGASSGIGRALAFEFASHGWNLVLVARRGALLDQLATDLRAIHKVEVSTIAFDLTASNAARALHDEISSRNLSIDCLVNNAGRGHFGEFIEQSWQTDEETIHLNISVLTSLCHVFAPDMVKRRNGFILNIASIAGFVPGPKLAVYHASKAYVLSLSQALHAELSPYKVSVTASCPGPTESEFFEKAGTQKLKALSYLKLMPAETVAHQAYQAMMHRRPIVVHGLMNRLMAESPRLMPKSWVAPLLKTFMK